MSNTVRKAMPFLPPVWIDGFYLGSWVKATSKPYTQFEPIKKHKIHKMKWHRHHMKQNKTYFENPSSSETLRNSEGCQCWLISQLIGLALLPSNVAPGMQDIDANKYQCRMAAILDWVVPCWTSWIWLGWADLFCSQYPIPSTGWTSILPEQVSINSRNSR